MQVRLEGETLWLSQAQMAQLFDTSTDNISLHLKNIYREGELAEEATAGDFLAVRQEGVRQVQRRLKHYNLDAVISIGYRVNSTRATRFRQWATQVLHSIQLRATVWIASVSEKTRPIWRQRSRYLVRRPIPVQSKAAHLLYFVIRNHPFADGNKRSGAFCLWISWRATAACCARGQPAINDVGLAAPALLAAESDAKNKEVMIRLIENMLAPPHHKEN